MQFKSFYSGTLGFDCFFSEIEDQNDIYCLSMTFWIYLGFSILNKPSTTLDIDATLS